MDIFSKSSQPTSDSDVPAVLWGGRRLLALAREPWAVQLQEGTCHAGPSLGPAQPRLPIWTLPLDALAPDTCTHKIGAIYWSVKLLGGFL